MKLAHVKLGTLAIMLLLSVQSVFAAAQFEGPLKLGTTAAFAPPLEVAVAEAKKQGLNVELIEFSDWIAPNVSLEMVILTLIFSSTSPSWKMPISKGVCISCHTRPPSLTMSACIQKIQQDFRSPGRCESRYRQRSDKCRTRVIAVTKSGINYAETRRGLQSDPR